MGKIKLNLESGAVVEKPLINAFRANNFEYVILDNEMNGSMGLPIILVCKLENGKLIKIEDQNEWQMVKEYLKNIIAGSEVELVKVPNVLPANDVYYTQLTLPVPSFDALKKAYTIAGSETENNESAVADTNPSAVPVSDQPVVGTQEVTPVTDTQEVVNGSTENVVSDANATTDINVENVTSTPAVDLGIPNSPVIDNQVQNNPVDMDAPIPVFGNINESSTSSEDAPIAPAIEMPEAEDTPSIEIAPNITSEAVVEQPVTDENEPVVSIAPESENESPFKEQKEAFMQACENMFDALVQKFEKELENNK